MLRRYFFIVVVSVFCGVEVKAQDNCATAITLCASSSLSRSTIGATTGGTDPALSCGDNTVTNSVWFIVIGTKNGNCTVTVNNINNNPGLDMEVYTGTCGALVSTGDCASGSSGTGGTMNVSFATTPGTTYYIMVDGNAGNQESFDIVATSGDDAIVARPDPFFNPDFTSGCSPLTVFFHDTTNFHGGSNPTYEWRINNGSYIPSLAGDTTITYIDTGTTSMTLRACNQQCGCKTSGQDITVQDLFSFVSYDPPLTCIGTNVTFSDTDFVLPGFLPSNSTVWAWDFGDPASGINNTASGQTVNHTFVGTPPFNVTLIVQGDCGPETTITVLNMLPQPTITITGPVEICSGEDLNLGSVAAGVNNPVTYSWSGIGSFSCTNCNATTISGLVAGGPYTMALSIVDNLGCVADTTYDVNVNPLPTVFAGGIITVCPGDSAQLGAAPAGGLPPYDYLWAPSAGLSNDTIFDPYTFNTSGTSYCVTVTDAKGCTSNPDCVTINEFPIPSVSASSANLCTTQLPLQNTFTVSGAGPGSTFEWSLSPSYSLITAAAPDSSDITADFPPVPAAYNFTVVVSDGVTGCIDTVPTSFSVDTGLTMSVAGPSLICIGDTATLTVSGADTFSWTSSPAYAFADPTNAVQVVTPSSDIVFTITGTRGTCTQTITDSLTVAPKPDAFVSPVPPYCNCGTVSLNGVGSTPNMTYLWTSGGGNPISAPTNISTSSTLCGSDAFTLTVTDTVSGCSTDSTITTSPFFKPAAAISVSPNLICNGVPTLISLYSNGSDTANTIFHWSCSNPLVVIADTSSKDSTTATVSTATVFQLTVTDPNGCDSTATASVNISPNLITSSDFPFLCASDPVKQSTITISGANPSTSFTWDSIPACVTPNSVANTISSQQFDFATCPAGNYNFVITVFDSIRGCTETVSEAVTILAGVDVVASDDTSFCEGGTAILVATGANSYVWGSGQTTDTIVINGLTAAGSPYGFIVVGSVGSCTDKDTIIVTVNPVPATSPISGLNSVCENDPVTQYSVTPPSANTYAWNVYGGVIVIGQGQPDVFVNWNTVGLDSISVVETTSNGCSGPLQSMNVIVNPLPVAPLVTGPDTLCNDEIAVYFVNANAGSVYTWTITGGNFISGPTGSVNSFQWTTAGDDTLTVFEQTSAGCIGPATIYPVNVKPRPGPVTVIGNTLVCDNVTEIYSLTANAGSVYTWNIVNDALHNLNASSDTMTVDWGTSGTGHVQVFETNSVGCNSDTTDLTVSISQHPQLIMPNDSANICNNVSYQLVTSASATSIRWTTDGNGTFSDTTISSPVYFPSNTDTGYIHLSIVASSPPCTDVTGTFVLYHTQSPIVSITGPAGPICFGTMDTLIATGGGTYIWTPGGIPFDTIGIRPAATTTYTVSVTNSLGCVTRDTITVYVIPPGTADAGSDQVVCTGNQILLSGSQQNATGILWSTLGDGTFVPDNVTANAEYLPGQNDTTNRSVVIILETTGGCVNISDTVIITIENQPYISAGNDTIVPSLQSANATIPLSPQLVNVNSLTWTTTGTGTFTPTDTTVNAVYVPSTADLELDSIIIIATSVGSCSPAIDSLIVEFEPFLIPNVFTPYPTSPGENDFFVVLSTTSNVQLKVWDRWGSLVYTSDFYQNDWDAHGLKADTYYYMIIAEEKKYKGWVQVIKDE